jgi:hypothetical protein
MWWTSVRAARLHMGASRAIEIDYLTSNNCAFGSINTSLIFRRV